MQLWAWNQSVWELFHPDVQPSCTASGHLMRQKQSASVRKASSSVIFMHTLHHTNIRNDRLNGKLTLGGNWLLWYWKENSGILSRQLNACNLKHLPESTPWRNQVNHQTLFQHRPMPYRMSDLTELWAYLNISVPSSGRTLPCRTCAICLKGSISREQQPGGMFHVKPSCHPSPKDHKAG